MDCYMFYSILSPLRKCRTPALEQSAQQDRGGFLYMEPIAPGGHLLPLETRQTKPTAGQNVPFLLQGLVISSCISNF